jgi:hypothetical protein
MVSVALAMATSAVCDVSADPVSARWLEPISGDWIDPARWSTNPQYPNNDAETSSSYDVMVDAVGEPYAITLENSQGLTVAGFVLDSPDATVVHRNFVFQSLGTFDLKRGTYQLGARNAPVGGTISNSTITSSGTGRILVPES